MKFYNVLSKFKFLLLLLLLLGLINQAPAQTDSRLKMAMLFKNSGNYEEALELYLQIYRSGKGNRLVINDIQFCYERLKRYADLIDFLNKLIEKYPNNPEYQVKLGKAYYLNEQRDKAFALWEQLLQKYGQNAYLYRLLGNVLIELRLYDKAIEVYQAGIKKTKSQYSLYRDIALLYRAQLEYGKAAISYLKYLQHFPKQSSFVNGQIIAMSADSSAVRQMIKAIEEFQKKHEASPAVQQILADLYLRNGDFQNAFRIYFKLHQKVPKTNYLLQFVYKARQNQAYEFAIKGLQLLFDQAKQSVLKQQYAYQIARNNFLWAKWLAKNKQNKKAQKAINLALNQIDQLLQSKTKTSYQWQALELRGDIYFEYFEDIDQAIDHYSQCLKAPLNLQQRDQIYLKLAKSYLTKGDLARSRKFLKKIKSKSLQNLVAYLKAELLFYEGKLTPAKKAFSQLSSSLAAGDSLKNNILQRLLLLNYAAVDSAGLVQMGQAEFLIAQKKLSQAADILKEVSFKNSPLNGPSAERAVQLFASLNKAEEVEAIVAHVLKQNPDYVNIDHLLFMLAATQEKQHQWQKAFDTYRLVISNYPNSFWVEVSRERARLLKEKLNKEQMP